MLDIAFREDKSTILVVEDDPAMLVALRDILEGEGYGVITASDGRSALQALVAELPGTVAVAADLGDASERERLMAEVLERCGTVDVLVNNAGVGHTVAIEDEDVDTFRHTMELNVTAVWHLCKLAGVTMPRFG